MTYRITDLASYFFAQIRAGEEERDRIYEPVIGLVTDNKDPDKLGRVKVKLPSISSVDDAGWAHVVALGAGKDRGWFFLPELDDEVLVMFEHGDIRRPIVIGQLWNGKDKPPLPGSRANGQRAIVSRGGSKLVFDDDGKKLVVQDGAGIGVITIDAEAKKITIEAKQGDICLQAPTGDLTIVAKELDVSGTLNVHIESLQGIAIGGDKAVTIKGQGILQVHGQSIDIQPGGVQAPQAAQAEPAEVADPLTATGSGQAGAATAARDQAQPSGGGGGDGGGASTTPQAASAPAEPQPEPTPLLVAAAWERATAPVSTSVKLTATCAGMAGKSASFAISDADDASKTVATVSGSCGDSSVEATWTTPGSGSPSRFVFEVKADGKDATSGVLTLVERIEGTLMLDEQPAANLPVVLRVDPGGDTLRAETDAKGVIVFEEAPLGERVFIVEEEG